MSKSESSQQQEDSDSDSNSNSNSNSSSNRNGQPPPFWGSPRTASRTRSSSSFDSVHAEAAQVENEVATAENERQILLCFLLAQVCALHDATPRTFIVHVLELYERGILERDSIGFLFDLGLVPDSSGSPNSTTLLLENDLLEDETTTADDDAVQALEAVRTQALDPSMLRAQEASAIRNRLQRHDSDLESKKQKPRKASGVPRSTSEPVLATTSSWAVEQHPLSLSRYQREFQQIKLLNSGSFGDVFQATNKMDGRTYAVKRVMFAASGYSNETVTQVVREVRCLAKCDHPNCVRYYTSWLEPSWVTGSGTAVSNADQVASKKVQRRLLTDIHQLVLQGPDDLPSASKTEGSSRFDFDSFGSYDDSEWTVESSFAGGSRDDRKTQKKKQQEQQKNSYRYQMCFYIQMEICKPTTLADWIRERNQSCIDKKDRYGPAMEIVCQIAKGIEHVHSKDIIHRDLKPANIFAGQGGQFKIGDFGLSKILRKANGGQSFHPELVKTPLLLPATAALEEQQSDSDKEWHDPLTAGIGTASYCAPEQVASQSYGPEADIFSLGLILLELFCSFGTEHERIDTFRACRRGQVPTWLNETFPNVADIILQCSNAVPKKRPTAFELLQSALLCTKRSSSSPPKEALIGELRESKREVERQKSVIAEKDLIISKLTRRMQALEMTDDDNPSLTLDYESIQVRVETVGVNVVDSTKFSDDDY